MPSCPLKNVCRPKAAPNLDLLTRREWVKSFVIGSATALVGGSGTSNLLADISPSVQPENILSFSIAVYPALLADYGSVRFNLFGSAVPNGIMTITRAPGDVFYAMSAYCTHAGCIVDPYDPTPGTEAMICYCHSSVYDIQGHVISGATSPQDDLPAYNTSFAGGVVRVEIPNLNLKVNSITKAGVVSGTQRYQLSFPVKQGGRYRVLHTPNLTAPPTTVSFSNTAAGTANQTQFNSTSNTTKNVWVPSNATSGFYLVEMVISEYTL